MQPQEIFGGNQIRDLGMDDFNNYVNNACLVDLRYISIFSTWSNGRINRDDFIERKLDRALINIEWLDIYPNSHANFQPPGISDHSHVIVVLGLFTRNKGMPFKFYNY